MTREERLERHHQKARMFIKLSADTSRFSSEECRMFAEEAILHGELSDKIVRAKHVRMLGGSLLCGMAIGAGLDLAVSAIRRLTQK